MLKNLVGYCYLFCHLLIILGSSIADMLGMEKEHSSMFPSLDKTFDSLDMHDSAISNSYRSRRSSPRLPRYKKYSSDNYNLYHYLMYRYKPVVRPVLNSDEPVMVGVYTYVYQIVEVDQPTNTIVLSACFELFWIDDFLQWRPEDFGGITETFFPSTAVWTPEISAYYSVASNRMLEKYTYLRVNYTGGVRYFSPFAVKNLCHIDVKYFPFDKQKCVLFFGPWAYRMSELDWNLLRDTADMADFYDNQEWLLEKTVMERMVLKYDYLGQQLNYSCFTLELHIARQSFYYIFNLVIPTAIISLVSVIGFHMPGSSAQMRDAKFRLGIMTILSMTMLLLAVVDDMPKFALTAQQGKRGSSSSVPLIGIYYFTLLSIIGLGTVTSSLFVALERRVRHRNVPWWIMWLSWQPSDFKSGYQRARTEPAKEIASDEAISAVQRKTTIVCARKDTLERRLSLNNLLQSNLQSQSHNTHILVPPTSTNKENAFQNTAAATVNNPLSDGANNNPSIASACSATEIPSTYSNTGMPPSYGSVPRSAASAGGAGAPAEAVNTIMAHRSMDELLLCLLAIEKSVLTIRKELYAFMPKNSIHERWLIIIYRLEWISMIIYLFAVLMACLMFFFHGWY